MRRPSIPSGMRGPRRTPRCAASGTKPGGEAYNYRNTLVGAGGKADNHSDLTAAETPETTRHLSDATLGPDDKDATGEAIDRAAASGKPGGQS